MILNLSELNVHVEFVHFKMDTLNTALSLITPSCFCASIDLSDAYYSVNVHPDFRKYLRFEYESQLYEFTCLPNGLSPGPRIFTKLLKPAFSLLRKHHGITIMGYLDDLLIVESDKFRLCQAIKRTIELFTDLGFKISFKKSQLLPSQQLEFLGFWICSDTMTVQMTERKAKKLVSLCKEIQKKQFISLRALAQLLGNMIATIPANPYAKLFSKKLEILKITKLREHAGNYETMVELTEQDKIDLDWWIENIQVSVKPIVRSQPDIIIYTDASNAGWGCHVPNTDQTTSGRWSMIEQTSHINVLELLAVSYSLKSLFREDRNVHIRIMTDNTVTMLTLQNQGSTASASCNEVCRKIWLWCLERNIWISLAHCPGKLNVEADLASRNFNDDTEWCLNKSIFVKICKRFGTPQVDIFASRLNKQIARFYSWQPDPSAAAVDAFTVSWTYDYIYAFPPFSIIPRVLQKIQLDGCAAILITPVWPNQPWFTTILQMLVAPPLLFQVKPDTLKLCHKPDIVHPLVPDLTLMATRLSANLCFREDFRRRCCLPSTQHENSPHTDNMTAIWPSGNFFVSLGQLIPLNQLYLKH